MGWERETLATRPSSSPDSSYFCSSPILIILRGRSALGNAHRDPQSLSCSRAAGERCSGAFWPPGGDATPTPGFGVWAGGACAKA